MKIQTPTPTHGVPDAFLTQFGQPVIAVLSGFDRLRFRAILRMLFVPALMETYLSVCHVLIKNFKTFAEATTARIKAIAYAPRSSRRPAAHDPEPKRSWQRRRKSVADRSRRAEVSRGANGRSLGALASVSDPTPLSQEAAGVCPAVTVEGHRHRALNPWGAPDGALLAVGSRGECTLAGFRNRDVRGPLHPGPRRVEEQRRPVGRVSRQLALLRAHGLIQKVSGPHRWLVTKRGRRRTTARLAARQAEVDPLTPLAA